MKIVQVYSECERSVMSLKANKQTTLKILGTTSTLASQALGMEDY